MIIGDKVRAEVACEAVFHTTIFYCMQKVEESRDSVMQSHFLKENPGMKTVYHNLFDGVQLKLGDVLLEEEIIDLVAKSFEAHRVEHSNK